MEKDVKKMLEIRDCKIRALESKIRNANWWRRLCYLFGGEL